MYITQYDIEMMLLIKPSDISRSEKNDDKYKDIITTCSNISQYDKCGLEMSKVDPCFTDIILKKYPQIDGYIAIAKQDAELFTRKYEDMLVRYNNIDKIKQIIPSIISNSRGVIGVPEFVIHPLRFRHEDCMLITEKFYDPERVVKYCINNRAQYNFFPLLYFTNKNIFSISDLKLTKNIKELAENSRVYDEGVPKIYDLIDDVFSQMLKDDGYSINNTIYKVVVDTRTGFYKAVINSNTSNKLNTHNKRNTRKKISRSFKDNKFEGYLNSYIVKSNNDSRLNTIVSSHSNYLDNLINDLQANGYSAKKRLLLNRGNKNNFIYKFYIDRVIDRPELEEYRNMRRRRKNITNKRRNNLFSTMLKLNGLNMNNLDEISSVGNNNNISNYENL